MDTHSSSKQFFVMQLHRSYLLFHDLCRVASKLLPLPRKPLPLLPVVVEEAAEVPQFAVVPDEPAVLVAEERNRAEAVLELRAQ